MNSFYENLKRILSAPLFYFAGIGLGLAFTALFCFFDPASALRASAAIFLASILLSLLMAFLLNNKKNVVEAARKLDEDGSHVWALKLLQSVRRRARDEEECLRIDYEISSVYCSMEQYHQAVEMLNRIVENCDTKWAWQAYLQLAKALSHTKGYYSDETLGAYISCVEHRKKFDEYGRGDLKQDIRLCHEIREIYKVKKNHAASNMWFREEMVLREADCDIGIKNKIDDLSDKAAVLADKKHAEEALRLYETAVHLIENDIGDECDRYAMVRAEMGKLFLKGYAVPRYDMALECFQKAVEIKRKYMSDIPEKLFDTFSRAVPYIQELCEMSLGDIRKSYMDFLSKRNMSNMYNREEFEIVIGMRDALVDKCHAVLPLFEEAYAADSLELADLYSYIGEAYKWCPSGPGDCRISAAYLEKTAKIWRKYRDDGLVQTKLARLLVDLGGTYIMQKDYEAALPYRIEALKTISSMEAPDIGTVAQIELALMKAYENTSKGKSAGYETFLKNNGLSTVIEHFQVRHLGNGWDNLKVKVQGVEKEYEWTMTQ